MGSQTTCDTLITAPVIIPQAGALPITDGAIAIRQGIILALGSKHEVVPLWVAKDHIALSQTMLMPGLVNAHCHVAMTYLRGYADDLPLMEWLTKYIFPIEQHVSPEIVELGALLGCAEMIRTGTTAFADMYMHAGSVCNAVHQSGLKVLAGEVIFGFPTPASPSYSDAFATTLALHEKWCNHPRIRIGIMPHTVYTTTAEILEACAELMRTAKLPIHMHVSETPEETRQSLELHGARPIEVCHRHGLLGPNVSIAHAVDVTDAEMQLLAETETKVAHNPKSNMKLASGTSHIPDLLKYGVHVGLGTDGAASNNTLNMFSEMSACALLHKLTSNNPATCSAQTVLSMATIGSATAIHRPELGTLAPGAPADIIGLDLTAPNMQPMYSPVSHAVYAASGNEVCFTMVDGTTLFRDGTYKSIDYPALLQEIGKLSNWVKNQH